MVNNNGFDLKDLLPATLNPASESPLQAQTGALTPPKEIDVITRENPRSLINLIPEGYREIIMETVNSPDNQEAYKLYLEGDSYKLDKKVTPTKIDHSLRYNLWTQYYQALETGAKFLQINRVCAGITTTMTFERVIRHMRIFWLLLPPTDYVVANRRAHDRGLDRLHQILDIDPVDEKTGKINTALINLQMKIFAILDTRLNGPITHKHEITTKNVHLGITADQVQKLYKQTQDEVAKLEKADIVLSQDDLQEMQFHHKEHRK